jgi:hypothetical protein
VLGCGVAGFGEESGEIHVGSMIMTTADLDGGSRIFDR